MKRILFIALFGLMIGAIAGFASAQTATVCCQQTISGAFCQNVPASECMANSSQVPTSCDATSYCKPGTCVDSSEGICLDNTPQLVCNSNGGIWSETSPPQCQLGCCILGDQAAFVTLPRCKKLSSFLGLITNYKTDITNEIQCVAQVQLQDKGACVYDFEFEKTCKFTTRAECSGSSSEQNGTSSKGTFYKDKLCSAEELATNCGPSKQTTCLPGKDEVYFVDTCGNPANIYDASKVSDKEYWTNVKTKDESCSPGSSNAGSSSCGNCNYAQGGYCRPTGVAGTGATYGDNVCADLNCHSTSNGNSYRHGESWCVYEEEPGKSNNKVGSRFFKHICVNGDEVVEACQDFRAEECIQDSINGFSQAACRVNRWQDCLLQTEQQNCENTDRRDCTWKTGVSLNETTFDTKDEGKGICLPKNSPGLNFWGSEETRAICARANKVCLVKFEKGLIGGEEKCVENCECLTDEWKNTYTGICTAMGDCGPKVNIVGKQGYNEGVKISTNESGESNSIFG